MGGAATMMVKLLRLVGLLACCVCGAAARADLLVVSGESNQVLSYDEPDGALLDVAATVKKPFGVRVGPDGDLYVTSYGYDRVMRFDAGSRTSMGVFASGGGLSDPHGLTFGPDGNLYVSSYDTDQILRYDGATGKFLSVFASAPDLHGPDFLQFGPDGSLYVSSSLTGAVLRFDSRSGRELGTFASGNGLVAPSGLAFSACGDLYIADRGADRVFWYDAQGRFRGTLAVGDGFGVPTDLAFAPDGELYVSGLLFNSVTRYDVTTGDMMGVATSDTDLVGPYGIAFTTVPEPASLLALALAPLLVRRRRP